MKYLSLLLLLSSCGTMECRETVKWVRCISQEQVVYDGLALENSCTNGELEQCIYSHCWINSANHKQVTIPYKSHCLWYDAKPRELNQHE